jgi:hypothetical protein
LHSSINNASQALSQNPITTMATITVQPLYADSTSAPPLGAVVSNVNLDVLSGKTDNAGRAA